MTASKNIISILFAMFMVNCSYSSLRPEVVDRSDAQRMQTVIFATVVSIDRVILSGDGDTGAVAGAIIGGVAGASVTDSETESDIASLIGGLIGSAAGAEIGSKITKKRQNNSRKKKNISKTKKRKATQKGIKKEERT